MHCRWLIFGGIFFLFVTGLSEGSNESTCEKDRTLVLLDMTNYCISKAKDLYSALDDEMIFNGTSCGKKGRPVSYLKMAKILISNIEDNYLLGEKSTGEELDSFYSLDFKRFRKGIGKDNDEKKTLLLPKVHHKRPTDCSQVLEIERGKSGIYKIWVADKEMDVYCDMDTDGGGWTVIQRRDNFTVQQDFYQDWETYKTGFGNLTQEFWLGNENIHALSNQTQYEMRIDLEDADGNQEHSGTAGDSMAYHNNNTFKTKDTSKTVCVEERRGGWWYDFCTESNLNGLYQPGVDDRAGLTWYSWHNHVSLKFTEMKIRRRPN
ncbi:hypothetical protein CEXT_141402 [Caerostris extrusa]|uniref:Fibrinogen C-terminal domain-containing protein n=1 Tax=Caerostris extrusa TaxID=172846 RepID=A0AAV4WU31_CAEEX|nr:hypothetical protein CEXT_141402 [Caerostris extrusa]